MTELVNMRVPNAGSFFNYWVDKDLAPLASCQYPKTYGVNYYSLPQTYNSSKGCNLDFTIPPGVLPPAPPYTLGTYSQYKQLTNVAQQAFQNNPTDSIAQWQYYVLSKQTQSIFEWLLDSARVQVNYTLQHQLFDAEGSLLSKHKRFGLYMRNNEYANALNLLNTMPNSLEGDKDYRYIQRVNLARLTANLVEYVPSVGVVDTLNLITTKNSVNSGFSGTLLELFGSNADYIVSNNNPCGGNNENRESKQSENKQTESIFAYPNPTSGIFTIQINKVETTYNILELHSVSGIILKKYNIEGNSIIQLNTHELSNGLYICKLKNTESGKSINVKMIVQH